MTAEKITDDYNNFYEFGTGKELADEAQKLPIRPWMIKFDGLVEKPFEIGIDELIGKMPLEERTLSPPLRRGLAMAIAWTGFPLASLVAFAKPLGGAKYVRMQTFSNPEVRRARSRPGSPGPIPKA